MLLPVYNESLITLRHMTIVYLFTEFMSAFADLETGMRLSAACRAFLLPALANGLLDLRFGCSCGSEADQPRFIRLLDGALGVNAAQ